LRRDLLRCGLGRLKPHRTIVFDAAEPAGRRWIELLSPDPAARLQAVFVEVGNDATPQSLLALNCTAFSRAPSSLSREKLLGPAPGLLQ
jgi:hypothetical protein